MPHFSAHQCHPSVPVSATYEASQCHLSVCISAA
ncbi:unnamed protein product [Staurois parvus]|uniref:Uncharacterized protein n=1 Tax=Staurois parvus TaxID=386267 RepID=A0ABN9EVA4_9NEOB|nr:unnamed protein product [Staurois parvus]